MSTMPSVPEVTEAQITQFLAAARGTIADVPLCWLATPVGGRRHTARAVNSSAGAPGSDDLTRRFLIRRESAKSRGDAGRAPCHSRVSAPLR